MKLLNSMKEDMALSREGPNPFNFSIDEPNILQDLTVKCHVFLTRRQQVRLLLQDIGAPFIVLFVTCQYFLSIDKVFPKLQRSRTERRCFSP